MGQQSDMIDQGLLDPTQLDDLINALMENTASRLGSFIPPGFGPYYKEPFDYTVNFPLGAALAGVVSNGSAQINNDSYFCWYQGSCTIFDNTGLAGNVAPNVSPLLVNIKDTSSGKYMADGLAPIGSLFGTGIQPVNFLYRAKVFNPGGQITVELTNPGVAPLSVRLVFTGFKIYTVLDASITPR